MSSLGHLIRIENLRSAWKWIQSNPTPSYKNYFRSLYGNYASADENLLSQLADRLKRDIYKPAHACKIYIPKGSGGLRPITLLTVEDQIVYQAYVNVIAEKFRPEIKKWYFSEVFSHILDHPDSLFFYKRWEKGFEAFNTQARIAFGNGLIWTARFDLTACYDSIDHNVLQHFLEDIGCDTEFCKRFRTALGYWTATGRNKRRIYQGHGIPQGPLSSGLVAEVVLHHFELDRKRRRGVKYLRYVDDIRLYAKTENEVRAAINDLDLVSKDIGLFPQTSKIKIHKVKKIEDEIKSISRPNEEEPDSESGPSGQDKIHKQLTKLTAGFYVEDQTSFKFLLSKAIPSYRINQRLWRVLDHHPELYSNIFSYFRRYNVLPPRVAENLIEKLHTENIHSVIIAEMISTAQGRISADQAIKVDQIVEKYWMQHPKLPPDLTAVLGRWKMKRDLMSQREAKRIVSDDSDWYARAELVNALDSRTIPQPDLNSVLLSRINDSVSDVAIAAAIHLGLQETTVNAETPMQSSASPVLSAFGMLDGKYRKACGIKYAFERLLNQKPPGVNWKKFFGNTFRRAEIQAIRWSGYLGDATAWVNSMHVFCDWLLDALFRNDPSIGKYSLGNIGSNLVVGSRLEKRYPRTFAFVSSIHDKRSESDLSHAKKRIGKTYLKPTSFIRFTYFKTAKRLAEASLKEISQSWPEKVLKKTKRKKKSIK